MAFIKGHEFIVENKLGEIFNFYLNEQKYIEYIVTNKNRKWREKEVVFSNITESMHVDIDKNSKIHIVSYNENGKLYYHQYYNDQWTNHLITEYPLDKQKIFYPTIKCIKNEIHIFYYLLQANENNKAYLLHLKFKDSKYSTNYVATIKFNKYINPFKIFVKDNKLLLLYASAIDEFEQIFISYLNINNEKWSEPLYLTSSKENKIYLDGLLYNDETLHLIWSNYDEEYLTVQYSNVNLDEIKKIEKSKLKTISLSSKSSCSFPVLIYYEKILWAIWTEMGKIVSCCSNDLGANWSKPYTDENSKNIDFKRYRYSTNNKNNILCDFIFGTLYPHIQFLGFGGEGNDEISKK